MNFYSFRHWLHVLAMTSSENGILEQRLPNFYYQDLHERMLERCRFSRIYFSPNASNDWNTAPLHPIDYFLQTQNKSRTQFSLTFFLFLICINLGTLFCFFLIYFSLKKNLKKHSILWKTKLLMELITLIILFINLHKTLKLVPPNNKWFHVSVFQMKRSSL